MALTTFTLGLLYVAFAAVLFYFLNVGFVPMLVLVGGLAVFQYYTSDKLALRAAGAKVIEREDAPQLFDTVERLVAMAELPMPRVAIVDTDVPNAFATGREPEARRRRRDDRARCAGSSSRRSRASSRTS